MPRDTLQLLEAPVCPEIQVLDRMRALLATPEQWCQGVAEKEAAYCLIGAMCAAAPTFADYQPVCNAMHAELKSFWGLHVWNDAPSAPMLIFSTCSPARAGGSNDRPH